jgi:hypothetical protein
VTFSPREINDDEIEDQAGEVGQRQLVKNVTQPCPTTESLCRAVQQKLVERNPDIATWGALKAYAVPDS